MQKKRLRALDRKGHAANGLYFGYPVFSRDAYARV